MNTVSPLEALFRYARTFEVAWLTGDWSVLEPHFTGDARHCVEGGGFLGHPATGRTAHLPIFCVFGCEGGVLTSERFVFDLAAMCEQIGVAVEDFRESLRPLRAVAA
jgi:hypothetical protein